MTMVAGQTDLANMPAPMPATGMGGDRHGDNVAKNCAACKVDITNKATYADGAGKEYCSMSCLDQQIVGKSLVDPEPPRGMEYVP